MKTLLRTRREEGDQEFVTLAAMLLCGDLDLRADTFQQITTKPEVKMVMMMPVMVVVVVVMMMAVTIMVTNRCQR